MNLLFPIFFHLYKYVSCIPSFLHNFSIQRFASPLSSDLHTMGFRETLPAILCGSLSLCKTYGRCFLPFFLLSYFHFCVSPYFLSVKLNHYQLFFQEKQSAKIWLFFWLDKRKHLTEIDGVSY